MAVRKIRESVSIPTWDSSKEDFVNKKIIKDIKPDDTEKQKADAIVVKTSKEYFKNKDKRPAVSGDAKKMKLTEKSLRQRLVRECRQANRVNSRYIKEDLDKTVYKFKSYLDVQTDIDLDDGEYCGNYDLYYNARFDQFHIVNDIVRFVESYRSTDFMEYIDDELKDIVSNIYVKVVVEDIDLVMYTFVELNDGYKMDAKTWKAVQNYLEGQFGDGWGENMEQEVCTKFEFEDNDGYSHDADVYVTVRGYRANFIGRVVAEGINTRKQALKESAPTVDTPDVVGGIKDTIKQNREDKSIKIYGWTLEITYPTDRLYSGPRYWLYNPSGHGGALYFYYDPSEIMEKRAQGKQVMGFEGNSMPKTVMDALLKKYVKGAFDNEQPKLKESTELNKKSVVERVLKEGMFDCQTSISGFECKLDVLRTLGYNDIADQIEELRSKQVSIRDAIGGLLNCLLADDVEDGTECSADPTIEEPMADTADTLGLDSADTEIDAEAETAKHVISQNNSKLARLDHEEDEAKEEIEDAQETLKDKEEL